MTDKKLNILFVGNSYTYYNQMPKVAFAELGLTREEMTEKISISYNKSGKLYGARVAEEGKAFLEYSKDNDKDDLYDPDKSHPSAIGSKVAARVILGQVIE